MEVACPIKKPTTEIGKSSHTTYAVNAHSLCSNVVVGRNEIITDAEL
jgi:hypothetical protein